MTTKYSWHTAAQEYLARLGLAEYQAGLASHSKTRKPSTYRHYPSQYHRDLVAALGRNDEHEFKAQKGLEGYASVVGV